MQSVEYLRKLTGKKAFTLDTEDFNDKGDCDTTFKQQTCRLYVRRRQRSMEEIGFDFCGKFFIVQIEFICNEKNLEYQLYQDHVS